MFGIDDALIWGPMIGAALGGLTSKRDPLKGALMGGALGLGGGMLAGPGLLGAAAAPAGITGASLPAGSAALLGSGAAAAPVGVGTAAANSSLASYLSGASASPGAGLLGSGLGGAASGGVGMGVNAAMPSLVSPGMLATASGTPAQVLAANPSMFQQFTDVVKPVGNIASSANAVKGLLGPNTGLAELPQVAPQPVATGQGGPQALASLVSGNAQNAQQIEMDSAQRKKRRQQLIA